MNLKFFLIGFLLLVLSSITFAQTVANTDSDLKLLVQKMVDAQRNYDVAALDRIYTADFVEISPLGEFDSRAKVLSFYTPDEKKKLGGAKVAVESVEHSIRTYDKFAVVIVRLNYNIELKGTPLPPRNLRLTLVCRNENGEWKIASAHYSGIREPSKKPA